MIDYDRYIEQYLDYKLYKDEFSLGWDKSIGYNAYSFNSKKLILDVYYEDVYAIYELDDPSRKRCLSKRFKLSKSDFDNFIKEEVKFERNKKLNEIL